MCASGSASVWYPGARVCNETVTRSAAGASGASRLSQLKAIDCHSTAEYIMSFPRGGEFSDDDEPECPLCMDQLDITDRNFRPCPCGYQVRWLATVAILIEVSAALLARTRGAALSRAWPQFLSVFFLCGALFASVRTIVRCPSRCLTDFGKLPCLASRRWPASVEARVLLFWWS